MGIGSELSVGEHWTVRGEITGPLYPVQGIELAGEDSTPGPHLVVELPSNVENVWQFSVGAGYRVGARPAREGDQGTAGRWEAGGQVARATLTVPLGLSNIVNLAGVGGFASYRLAPGIYADGAVSLFPQLEELRTEFSGGRLSQAVGGVKLGTRRDGYGFFAKVRLGINSHSGAVTGESDTSLTVGRYNATAVDVGGVFERYIGRRWLVRFDGGDVVSVFHPTSVTFAGIATRLPAPSSTDSILLTVGAGLRF